MIKKESLLQLFGFVLIILGILIPDSITGFLFGFCGGVVIVCCILFSIFIIQEKDNNEEKQ